MLESHGEQVVKANARNIIYAALNKGNLELVDRLAAGAKDKLDMLESHGEQVVKDNARTIIYAALNKGDLELVDRLDCTPKSGQ